MRVGKIERKTNETDIALELNLDGTGNSDIETGIGFFDHMLQQIARHGVMDLKIAAKGDLHIDPHHTVEDVGICLGRAFTQALGEPKGIQRYGFASVPMDEALGEVSLDISGRPFLVFNAAIPGERVGEFDTELTEEFFRAFAMNARITLHLNLRYGSNSHHCIEGLFKAAARALRQAVSRDDRVTGIPSSKGALDT
ncbi:MAG: imidazoleglycerol-phosphate dehydratase HisB [Candidatus Hydrogenedens sp.]|nr:imidazoleglycerol-phosphate dehydratase HisB [Candidatus Hydrogenedens sp.]